MPETILVEPADGRLVFNPATGKNLVPGVAVSLPARVPYWRRRIRDGDVVEVTITPKAKAAPKPTPTDTDKNKN